MLETGVRPVMLQLQAQDWCEVMQGGGGCTKEVLQLPAVQAMNADQIALVLQTLAARHDSCAVELLTAVPAAQQLTPEQLSQCLEKLLRGSTADWNEDDQAAWDALLRMQPAQHIAVEVLQQLVDSAASCGRTQAIRSLQQQLPQAAGLQCGLGAAELMLMSSSVHA